MPEVSPRRSSRARAVNPPPNKLTHKNSSSSASSNKAERNSRSNGAHDQPETTPSERSDETEHLEPGTRQTRRQKREQEAAMDPKPAIGENTDLDEDGEEEVTRCICEKLDYPGPPRPSGDRRDAIDIADPDAGGMFIQCDICKVWQHGGCVGIMDEASSPENYYCEECRPSYHRIMPNGRAQKYSRYLPVVEPRSHDKKKTSTKDSESRSSKEADSKQAAMNLSAKRRSTMNSRAAYDEEEVFRRVLEESKGNNETDRSISGTRKGKRAREDSDSSEHDLKRRRTGSQSPPQSGAPAIDADSEEDSNLPRAKNNGAKGRSGKAQAEQERDFRVREKEREQERQAAANRRKGRADRRRVDGMISDRSNVNEPTNSGQEPEVPSDTTKTSITPKAATSTQIKLPKATNGARQQNVSPPRTTATSHKKSARPARRGKVGRNQYTRDRDAAADARAEAARALHSRDGDDVAHGEFNNHLLPNGSKPARPKHMNPNRTSMNELRKRAAGIMEYISRTQIEMAGDKTPSGTQTPMNGASRPPTARGSSTNGASKLSKEVHGDDDGQQVQQTNKATESSPAESQAQADSFKQMSTLQMMDVLTREIVHWQQQHGKWGEK